MSSPRFRLGHLSVSVQRSNTVREIRSPSDAQRLIETAVEQLGPRFVHELLRESGRSSPDADEHGAMRTLAQHLLDGTFVVVVHDTGPRLLDAPHSVWLRDLIEDGPGAEQPLKPRPPAELPLEPMPPAVEVEPAVETGPRCVRLIGMLFAPNKAFLLPEAMEGIRLLAHMYSKVPGAELLAVGHTDTTGTAWRNRSLSLQRAESILQFITDDVDGWYQYYTKDTDFSRRWGKQEDLAMLSVLPSRDEPFYGEHHHMHTLEAAVRRFQAAKELVVDGDPGPLTRKALIADYMAIDGTTLPRTINASAHGCGQSFLAVPTDDGVEELENRRVEIFLFPDGIDPRPSGTISEAGTSEYLAWNEAVVEERTFVPGKAGHGALEVVTDIEQDHQPTSGVTFILRATDGAYERELLPVEGHVVRGYTVLEFTDMPVGSFYTLSVRYASGAELSLFEDIPYRELSGAGNRGVDALLDPFTLAPIVD